MAVIEGESIALARGLRALGAAIDTVRFRNDDHPLTITLEFPRQPPGAAGARGGCLVISRGAHDGVSDPTMANAIAIRALRFTDVLSPHLPSLLETSDFRLTVNVADGGVQGGPLSLDRPAGSELPLFPDIYLLSARAPPADPTWPEFRREFMARKPVLFWRGSTTGGGRMVSRQALLDNPRVRACRTLGRLPPGMADCRITRIVQAEGFDLARASLELRIRRLMGPRLPESVFRQHQMTIDLAGNSAAWGACLKYLAGCLVLRPPPTHELIYSRRLEPWIHYVPVSADFVDAEERIAWVVAHPAEAAQIAWRGRRLMASIVRRIPTTIAAIAERRRDWESRRFGRDGDRTCRDAATC